MRRQLAAATAVLAVCVLAPAGVASAAPLTLGFSNAADPSLTNANPATESFWVTRAHAVDAQMVRLFATWASIAPAVRPAGFVANDPSSKGYDWTDLDRSVRDLRAAGFRILLTVLDAPRWAEGPGMPKGMTPGVWEPSATDLGEFATALARRYDGRFADPLDKRKTLPRVCYWQAWNEPNLSVDLAPQWLRTPSGPQAESPVLYRAMENAFYAAIKGVNASNFVVQAGVAPYGDYPAGGARMSPVTFDQVMFCLSAKLLPEHCADPVHLDAIDSHPYGIYGPTWHALDPGDVAVPDVTKLTRLLRLAEQAGTVLPRGPKQNWVTEIAWDTKPPNPQGVPVLTQAHWLEQSLYVLWRQGVSTILWFQLGDAPPIPSYDLSFEGGIYFLNGEAKPGATAFRFPFLTNRLSPTTVEAWGRPPVSGTVTLQIRLTGGAWRTISSVAVAQNRIFEVPLEVSGAAQLRAVLGAETSLTWDQSG